MIPAPGQWYGTFCKGQKSRRLALAALCGVFAGGAMAPYHLVFLLVPGFSGLLWLIDSSDRKRAAFSIGWAFGVGHFATGFYWVSHAFLVDAARYGWMAPIAVLALAAGMAVFIGFTTLISWRISGKLRLTMVGQALILAAVWISFEWLRSWLFTGFPWNLMGTVWAFSDAMMQFAAYGGLYGLGLVTVAAAAVPGALADKVHMRAAVAALVIAVLGLGAVWGGGMWRLSAAAPAYVPGVKLRLVQPNIAQNLKWKSGYKVGHVKKQAELSVQASKDGIPPTHIIWAETAVPFNLVHDRRLLSYLGSIAPKGGYIIVGAPRSTPPGSANPTYWNSLHALAPGGAIAAVYDKIHLVPFGEYVPFRNVFNFSKLTAGRVDFSPGSGPRVWTLPGLPAVAPLICYEAIFPAEVASLANETQVPEWLLNVTNDAWFGMSAGPYQHFASVRFRAIEMGVPLVRVANTGISAVVDSYGRVGAHLDLGIEGVVDSPLPKHLSTRPPYGRYGDWITLVVIMVALMAGVLLRSQKTG